MKLWRHMRTLWPRYTLAPAIVFWGWCIFWILRGKLRWEHVAMAVAVSVLAYGNRTTRRLFFGLVPIALVGLLYDAMRFVQNAGLTESNVHVCDLRAAEAALFGFGLTMNGQPATVHDWFQAHAMPWLDVACAIPYATFLLVVASYALYLFFRDFGAQQRFTWGFFLLNVAGFITYHIYPAAPPWYFHGHGCTVDLHTLASPGPNLTRVDALLGIQYFAGFYGRSSDVFGAFPSLHVSYPLLMVLEGWSKHRAVGRGLLVLFYLSMCFSAVYLDHHWIVDVVAGSLYAVATFFVMRKLGVLLARQTG